MGHVVSIEDDGKENFIMSLFTTRIYEILRTQYYRFEREQSDVFAVPRPPKNPYSIAELKFTLNVVDVNASKAVKRLVEMYLSVNKGVHF